MFNREAETAWRISVMREDAECRRLAGAGFGAEMRFGEMVDFPHLRSIRHGERPSIGQATIEDVDDAATQLGGAVLAPTKDCDAAIRDDVKLPRQTKFLIGFTGT